MIDLDEVELLVTDALMAACERIEKKHPNKDFGINKVSTILVDDDDLTLITLQIKLEPR